MVTGTAVIIIGLIGVCAAAMHGDNRWALLVASTGVRYKWINYCIQSSVCHSYHSIRATGIPADRVIVMMPDDVVNDPRNAGHKGKIYTRPNGTDVYAGVKIDYRGKDVTIENFLNILSGNKKAMAGKGTGRVVESDESSNLFVYLSDHGMPNAMMFEIHPLYAHTLHRAIAAMHSQKKYSKMFFYGETCFSGSMFQGLYPADMNVFAMTSATATQEAWMCNCGTEIHGACMAIEFSAGWTGLLDSQKKGTALSFEHIFQHTKKFVQLSDVSHYGNLKLGSDEIIANKVGVTPVPEDSHCLLNYPRVSVTEAPLYYLKWQVAHAKDPESLKEAQLNLDNYIQEEQKIEELKTTLLELLASEDPEVKSLHLKGVTLQPNIESLFCYQDFVDHFMEHCIPLLRFSGHFTMFSNACVKKMDLTKLKRELITTCEPYKSLIS